jgi:tetratricopeptide (TPR) repeat protein
MEPVLFWKGYMSQPGETIDANAELNSATAGGDVILQGQLSGQTPMLSIFAQIQQRAGVKYGLLSFERDGARAFIFFEHGDQICGGLDLASNRKGLAAVREIIGYDYGRYVYYSLKSAPQRLQQGIKLPVSCVFQDPNATPDSSLPALTEEHALEELPPIPSAPGIELPPGSVEQPAAEQQVANAPEGQALPGPGSSLDIQKALQCPPALNSDGINEDMRRIEAGKSWTLAELERIPTPTTMNKPVESLDVFGQAQPASLLNFAQQRKKVEEDIERAMNRAAGKEPAAESPAVEVNERSGKLADSGILRKSGKTRPLTDSQSSAPVRDSLSSARLRQISDEEAAAQTQRPDAPAAHSQKFNIIVAGLGLVMLCLMTYSVFCTYSARLSFEAGVQSLKKRNSDAAIEQFSNALKADARLRKAYMYRALAYGQLGKPDKAIIDYSTVIASEPKNVEALLGRASQYLKNKQYDDAAADCTKVLELSPAMVPALRMRALAEAKSMNYERAIADCDAYLKAAGNSATPADLADVWGTLALMHTRLRHFGEAINDYTKALAIEKENPVLYAGRAEAYKESGQWRRTLDDSLHASKLDPSNCSYSLRAACRMNIGDQEGAARDLAMALREDPHDLGLHRLRGKLELAKGNWAGAIADFDEVLKIKANDADAIAGYRAASAHMPHTSREALLAELQQQEKPQPVRSGLPAQKLPANADVLVRAGYDQLMAGNNTRAVQMLTAAVNSKPADVSARRYLAHALALCGQDSAAIVQFAAVTTMSELTGEDVLCLAQCFSRTNQIPQAITKYHQYLSMHPDSTSARVALIQLFERSGQKQLALSCATEGMHLSKTHDERQMFADAVDRIRSGGQSAPVDSGS